MSGYDHSYPETLLDKMALQIMEGSLSPNGFNNKHPEYYEELLIRTDFLPSYAYVLERFWHIANKTDQKPICIREGCEDETHWRRANKAHTAWCSMHCLRKYYWENLQKEEEINDVSTCLTKK